MNKEKLIKSAQELKQPSTDAAKEFDRKQDPMTAELNKRMSSRPDLDKLVGESNLSMMEDNSRNMARFMSSVFFSFEPEVLVETVAWVFRAYRTHGFTLAYWPANLDTFVEIMKDNLSKDSFSQTYPFFNWLIVNIPAFVKLSDEIIANEK